MDGEKMTSLERAVLRMNEFKEKKKQKEKKKEKAYEKKKKRQRHKRTLERKKKYVLKYNREKRKKIFDEKIKNGDEYAYFSVYLFKNKIKCAKLFSSWWKSKAMERYNKIIENNKKVRFPKEYSVKDYKVNRFEFEIVVTKNLKDDEDEVTYFRNEDGMLVETISDFDNHAIIAKHPWYKEESFYVYGYHPVRDRKDYNFILNNMILNDINSKWDIKTIYTYQNKLLIRYIDDFDFVITKNKEQCDKLFYKLLKDTPKQYKNNIIYVGNVHPTQVSKTIDDIVEKTGWERLSVKRPTG